MFLSSPQVGAQTCVDVDGNSYQTVWIGFQLWTGENLRTTSYRNGDPITTGLDDTTWAYASEGAYCFYENNPTYQNLCGNLYNWHAVTDPRGLCPEGWHVPSHQDWLALETYLGVPGEDLNTPGLRGDAANAGGHLKATTLWNAPNTGADNSTGFGAFGCGMRKDYDYAFTQGQYADQGTDGNFWASNNPDHMHRYMKWNSGGIGFGASFHAPSGLSCRCLHGEDVGVDDSESKLPILISLVSSAAEDWLLVKSLTSSTYYISDLNGRLVASGRFNLGLNTIAVKQLNSGIYFVRLAQLSSSSIRFVRL